MSLAVRVSENYSESRQCSRGSATPNSLYCDEECQWICLETYNIKSRVSRVKDCSPSLSRALFRIEKCHHAEICCRSHLLYGSGHFRLIVTRLLSPHIIQKEHAISRTHSWYNSSQNTHALMIGPIMQDKFNEEYVSFHGLGQEEVVRYKSDSALQSGWKMLVERRLHLREILNHNIQLRKTLCQMESIMAPRATDLKHSQPQS